VCKFCGGHKHLLDLDTGTWKRCACLDLEERDRRCAAAGIPEIYWSVTASSLLAMSPQLKIAQRTIVALSDQIKSNGLRGQYCVIGLSRSVKTIGLILLKAGLYRDEGMFALVEDVTASYMHDRSRELFRRARTVPVLLLVIGMEYPNKMDKFMVDRLLSEREDPRFGTIVATTCLPATLVERYGERPLWNTAVVLPSEEFSL
jgi:hypothetical protein